MLANIISSIAAFAGLVCRSRHTQQSHQFPQVAGLLLGSAGPFSSWLLTATVTLIAQWKRSSA